jgi:acetoin utilization protein AcuC
VKRTDGPLLVYGPRSSTYDFGPQHPLTPRRFGPGIDLLRHVGAEPALSPEPAPDADLLLCHTPAYIGTVRRFSEQPFGPAEAGIGQGGDNPAFAGMHEAAAMVAGGSLRAVEAILRGEVEHAFHPGGGLHHAMADRAAGFCIYDDPALAIARARRDGLRVLYVDLDVHHGDGVEALHAADPGVLSVSFHESGRYLFPGSGFAHELGDGEAAGTIVNVPFEPYAGEAAWLPAVERLVPMLAAAFGPDLVVSQHGADSHAWDPLAHLNVTSTAMGAAARLVDRVAHRFAGGRWLSTGGGGYDAYRVVPRTWAHVWLAGAHREAPAATPPEWRERWAAEAARYGQAPLPTTFDDEPNAGEPRDAIQLAAEEQSTGTAVVVGEAVIPALLRAAAARGWWAPLDEPPAGDNRHGDAPDGTAEIVDLGGDRLSRLRLAPRVVPPASPAAGQQLLERAIVGGEAAAVGAVVGDLLVGLALVADGELLALGVAPAHRRRGLAGSLLARLADRHPGPIRATVTVAERDAVDPLPRAVRVAVARRLLERSGFRVGPVRGSVGRVDASAIEALRP